MPNRIQIDPEQLAALYRRYHVRKLAAFGSILREDFNPAQSDADFLAEFETVPVAERMKTTLLYTKRLLRFSDERLIWWKLALFAIRTSLKK